MGFWGFFMFFFSRAIRLLATVFFLSFSIALPTLPNQGIWSQIAPRMASNIISTNPTNQQLLQLCTCNALSKHGIAHDEINQELLQTLDSVNIFSDVAPRLAQANLFCGYMVFVKNFTQLTDNLQTLNQRQKLTSCLQNDTEFFTKLDTLIKSLQSVEAKVLWCFYPQQNKLACDDTTTVNSTTKPAKKSSKKSSKSIISSLSDKIENHKYWPKTKQVAQTNLKEFWQRFKHAGIISACSLAAYHLSNYKNNCKSQEDSLIAYYKTQRENTDKESFFYNYFDYMAPKEPTATFSNVVAVSVAIQTIFQCSQVANFGLSIKADFDGVYEKQQLLIALAQMLHTVQEIQRTIENHPEVQHLFPQLERITTLARYKSLPTETSNDKNKISAKLKAFLELLDSSSFKGKPSYYFSWQGTILQAHSEFLEIKHELIPYFEALGHIDAQLSLIKIMQHHNNANLSSHFCIPTWIESDLPEIYNVDFWHPMISADKAVTNSMFLGGNHGPANAIVTGANAGGKTTALSAIMIGQIMAQSLGIAPALSLRATPFAKLHTYLDITTNLAQNESLFMAQANRAEKLQKSILSCAPGQKSLSILDEIFTGTRADFASQASYEFAEQLGSMPHSICILATHFPQLTQLEALKLFVNYKTQDAIITPEGSLIYPYKIVPGISDQNIAKHILQKKGIIKQGLASA